MPGPILFSAASDVTACRTCGGQLSGSYFRIDGRQVCGACRDKVAGSWPRASLFGTAAALLCGGIYYAIWLLLDVRFSVLPVIAGVVVGSAVRAGAGIDRLFGMRVFAVVMTYLAVMASYVHSVQALPDVASPLDALARSLVLPFAMALQGKNVVSLVLLAIGLHEAYVFAAPNPSSVQGPFAVPSEGVDALEATVVSQVEAEDTH